MTLGRFEKRDVKNAGMEIPGAAGGLREPLRVSPVELHLDETCVVIMKLAVEKIRFDPVKDDEDRRVTRVHVMRVVESSFVDESVVASILEETRKRIEEQRALDEAAAGTPQLPLGNGAAPDEPRRKSAEERLAEDAARPFPEPDRSPRPSVVG